MVTPKSCATWCSAGVDTNGMRQHRLGFVKLSRTRFCSGEGKCVRVCVARRQCSFTWKEEGRSKQAVVGCAYEEGRVGLDFVRERANGRVVEGEGHESFLHLGEGHELLQQHLPVVPHHRRICTPARIAVSQPSATSQSVISPATISHCHPSQECNV
jgi:hypothetical protein